MSASSRLFCAKPFKWFEVSRWEEEGDTFLCCPSWLEKSIGNLTRQSVEELWNGPVAQEIRSSILDGSFRYCNRERCPHLQTVSGPVQRVEDIADPEILDVLRRGSTRLEYGPRQINCSYDQSCNLSCPSCRKTQIIDIAGKDRILSIENRLRTEALPSAELLYITGSGDPFGSPFFRRWLQTMRRSDMPRLQALRLHSNGLLWTPKMWETIDAEVRDLVREAHISIDAATAATYAVNRRGGSFEKLLRNLEFIAELRAKGPLRWLVISMVVQENNFEEMPAFVDLGRGFGADTVYFSQLDDWGTFEAAELERRSVHRPNHPRHAALCNVLRHPAITDPRVNLGNLTDLHRIVSDNAA
jgi:hypothetical protein